MEKFYDATIKDSGEVWVQEQKYVASFVNSDAENAKFVEKSTPTDMWENQSQATTP